MKIDELIAQAAKPCERLEPGKTCDEYGNRCCERIPSPEDPLKEWCESCQAFWYYARIVEECA